MRSLRVRLSLGLGLLAVLLTTALALVIGELATNVARNEIGRYLTRLSIEMRDKLDVGMFERVAEVEMLSRLDAEMEGARNPAARHAMLAELKRATPDYAWLGYADATGRVQVSLDGHAWLTNVDGTSKNIDPGVHEIDVLDGSQRRVACPPARLADHHPPDEPRLRRSAGLGISARGR